MERNLERVDNPFDMLGTDIATGSALFDALQISQGELMSPQNVSKLREIAAFFDGKRDAPQKLRQLVRKNSSPHIRTLDHVHNYVAVLKRKEEIKTELKNIDDEIKYYE